MVKIYSCADTGPSGHGTVFRGHIRHLMDENVELTVRTQDWDWNREGRMVQNGFSDYRFREKIMNSKRFNREYLSRTAKKPSIYEDLGMNSEAPSNSCIIRDFEDREDIWFHVGGLSAATQAPQEDDIYTILETDWNLDKVPRKMKTYAEMVDEVWIPNEWNRKAFEERGIDNVKVMPYGVDFNYRPTNYDCSFCPGSAHTKPEPGAGECLGDEKFTFVAVGRWVHLKAMDRLLEAYIKEFSKDEEVRMFIKTTMNNKVPFDNETVHRAATEIAKDQRDMPELQVCTDMLSNQHLFDLLGDVSDCFVMPSRGECVGIAWIQAMHCRTPVITTDWSAMNEYLTDEHAILLKNYKLEKPKRHREWLNFGKNNNGYMYPPDAKWADPQVQELQQALRKAYEMKEQEKNKMTKKARKHVHQLFDWNKHIQKRIKRYKEVTN